MACCDSVPSRRVGDVLDYDKLTIEIWSNGSVDVNYALSKAASLLIEHFMQIASITGKPQIAETIEEVAVEAPKEDEPAFTIEDLELSVRAYNCLKRAPPKRREAACHILSRFSKKTLRIKSREIFFQDLIGLRSMEK